MLRPSLLRRAVVGGLLALAHVTAIAAAADTTGVLTDYRVASWTEQDGLPVGTIWSITQDADGYLWLGTDAGLIRFDGTRFLTPEAIGRPAVPADGVRVVHATRDGSLWIGFAQQGIARLRGNELKRFGESDGLPAGTINSIVQDGSGTLWAGTDQGVYRLAGERWSAAEITTAQQSSAVMSLSPTHALVVGTRNSVFSRPAASDTFAAFHIGNEPVSDALQDKDGRLWITDRITGFRQPGAGGRPAGPRNGKGTRLMVDRAGSLWVATFGQGVWRVRTSPDGLSRNIEVASDLNGLSNNVIYALFEDREGNIWAGTSDGLNRLTQHRVSHLMNVGLVTGVEPAGNGNVWAATTDGVLLLSRTGEELRSFPAIQARATHADRKGTLWVGTDTALVQVHPDGRVVTAGHPSGQIRSIASDSSGNVILITTAGDLQRFAGGDFEQLTPPAGLERRPSSLYTGRDGKVWIASGGQLIALAPSGTTTRYGPQNGLDVGALRELFEDSSGVLWVAGSGGLARVQHDRATSVHRSNGLPAESLTGIIEDAHGTIWIGAATGIIRLDDRTFDAATGNLSSYFAMYDSSDGVAGTTGWIGQRSVVRGDDGRFWFLTSSGVTIVDPSALTRNDRTHPLNIEQVLADETRFFAATTAAIDPGVSRLQIYFSIPNLTSPRRTRFRYRLEGFDTAWIDGGRQRVATYTNLPPREYRFMVEATTDGGSWGGPTSTWQFSVRPAFYQTYWFSALCVALLIGAGWTAWRVRVLQVRRQFAMLLAERTRLSRELHDTLLQSLVGVALRCDALASEAETEQPASIRGGLVRLRKQVEGYIRECRQSIWELRSATLDDRALHQALNLVADRAAVEGRLATDVAINGTPRGNERRVEEQILRIAQEASTNAARHSGGHRLSIRLAYEPHAIVLRVDDDGRGFDPLDPMHQVNGHYGLVSMRERAESVGGTFSITSSAPLGTSIQVSIPYASGVADEHEADSDSVHGRSSDRPRRNRADHQPAA